LNYGRGLVKPRRRKGGGKFTFVNVSPQGWVHSGVAEDFVGKMKAGSS